MKQALEVVSIGTGIPAFVNDNVCIPSLILRGISEQDAIEYCTMGCLEIEVPGKWGYRANGKSKFNIAKVLEMAIYGGEDLRTGQCLKSVKSLKDCSNFEEFF
jgi:formate C-acetyltransferase